MGFNVLQFGHDVGVVETRQPGDEAADASRFNSATTLESWRQSPPPTPKGKRQCFNSATTLESWRRGWVIALRLTLDPLQFGHDVGVVETTAAGRASCPKRGGFNSATTLESWRRLSGITDRDLDELRFNSATTLESWRRYCPRPA